MKNYKKNLKLLSKNHVYSKEMEHDACGVGLIASTEGKKSREIVEYGIEALKAVWHRGAVDADGKSGDGAGIKLEISPEFFVQKILETGHKHEQDKRICVGMVFTVVGAFWSLVFSRCPSRWATLHFAADTPSVTS